MISNGGFCNSLQVTIWFAGPTCLQILCDGQYYCQRFQADKANMRSASFGALFCGRFSHLPRAAHCGVMWEAQVLNQSLFDPMCLFKTNNLFVPSVDAKMLIKQEDLEPKSSAWQVKVGEGVPCMVTPLKPKNFLLGRLTLEPSTAVKLK